MFINCIIRRICEGAFFFLWEGDISGRVLAVLARSGDREKGSLRDNLTTDVIDEEGDILDDETPVAFSFTVLGSGDKGKVEDVEWTGNSGGNC